MGAPKKPFYRIVAVDDAARRDGDYIENVGTYDPTGKDESKMVTVKEEKILSYLNQGAIPTDTVKSILKKQGIWKKYKTNN
jgi:small subunit ribosomal protein S16